MPSNRRGFMGRIGVGTAAVLTALVGAAIVANTIELTGSIVLNEAADHSETPTAGKGQIWLESDTTPNTLWFTDENGTDTQLGATGGDVVSDTTPQLGGQLDTNGQCIGDGTLEQLCFVEDASAVNHIEIEHEATGSGPTIRAVGDDTNIDLHIAAKGDGEVIVDNAANDGVTFSGSSPRLVWNGVGGNTYNYGTSSEVGSYVAGTQIYKSSSGVFRHYTSQVNFESGSIPYFLDKAFFWAQANFKEMAAPSGSANHCQTYATDESTVSTAWIQCGASGAATQLTDESGNASFAGDVTVTDDIFMTQNTGLIYLDDDEDTYIKATLDDQINLFTGGSERFKVTTLTETNVPAYFDQTIYARNDQGDGGLNLANDTNLWYGILDDQTGTVTLTDTVGGYFVGADTTSAGVTFNLDGGALDGRMMFIFDQSANAATNNITISRSGSDTIGVGAATSYTISTNSGYVEMIYNKTDTNWMIIRSGTLQ